MKKITLLLSILSVILISSCSKDKKYDPIIVEYKITPMNVYFTKIAYNDFNGQMFTITNHEEFIDGATSIPIEKAPFTAKMQTEIVNTTSSDIYYDLVISVNHQVKKIVSASAPANSTATASAEYILP